MLGFFKRKKSIEINELKEEPAFANGMSSEEEYSEQMTTGKFTIITDDDGSVVISGSSDIKSESEREEPILETPTEFEREKSPREIELENHIGELVICLSEDIENPVVGVGIEVIHLTQSHVPVLSVYDIVRKEKFIPSGIIFDYTEQKFDALNQMGPNARIALFFNRLGKDTIDKQEQPNRPLLSSEEWKIQVKEAIDRINRGEWT